MNSSCDEEDISDEECWELLDITILRRRRIIRPRPNHFNIFNDAEFYKRFRMSKRSAYTVLELIAPFIKNPTNWYRPINQEHTICIICTFSGIIH